MHFHIITPTYDRPELLKRNILSVQSQSHQMFTHYIIDDSISRDTEGWMLENTYTNTIYIRNPANIGSNTSKNKALDMILRGSDNGEGYVLFLDDDDYLAPDALSELVEKASSQYSWYISRRTYANAHSITHISQGEGFYDYTNDYLLGSKVYGDATHIIAASIIYDARFASDIKNGEEWIFFLQIACKSQMYFLDLSTTLTDGYQSNGLTHAPIDIAFRRKMLSRMYHMVTVSFPHASRWKIILAWISYLPGIYTLSHFLRTLLTR